jgi:dihydrofolate reductase
LSDGPSPDIALIAAVAENGVIGAKGGLPWRVKSDFRHFRATTMGKPVIMGRRTFESIGKPLDGRINIVVTRQAQWRHDGVTAVRSLEAALTLAKQAARDTGASALFVIGGGELFHEALPLAQRLYITHINAAPEGDVSFPDMARDEWREVSREELPPSDGDTATAIHAVYERR